MDAMLRLGIEKTIFSFGACAGAAVACRSKSAARRKDRRARNLFERQNRSVINAGNLSTGDGSKGESPGCRSLQKRLPWGDFQSHLLQRSMAAEAEGIRRRLLHLEVVVALADDKLDRLTAAPAARGELARLAGGRDGGGALARLAPDLGRLERTVADDERRVQLIQMALRAELLLGLVVELDVLAAFGEPRSFQIVHAAYEHRAFEDVLRQIEFSLPVGDRHAAAEMRAGGVSREINAVGVAAKRRRVFRDPRDSAPHLIGHARNHPPQLRACPRQ